MRNETGLLASTAGFQFGSYYIFGPLDFGTVLK
jgi:hypothetical protein